MSDFISFLVLRSQAGLCALPVTHVIETFRPLKTSPVGEAAPWLLGLSQVRGEAVPVVSLNRILGGSDERASGRYVSLRVAGRRVVLAVDEVLDVRDLDASAMNALPPLLADAAPAVQGVAAVDRGFFLILQAARLLSQEDWQRLSQGAA